MLQRENQHWSRKEDVKVNKEKTGLVCGSVERPEEKQIRGFFMGCERALLAEKIKNTLCIISLSLRSDKPRSMQREREVGAEEREYLGSNTFEGWSKELKRPLRS